jgi:hypothetical protein
VLCSIDLPFLGTSSVDWARKPFGLVPCRYVSYTAPSL